MSSDSTTRLIAAAAALRDSVNRLKFAAPVSHVYNPLDYAWAPHEAYLRAYGKGPKRVIFLGMNPGPFGMAQVGVPFGEVAAVRDWMKITAPVNRPKNEHPKRPVEGFACVRSEVSGQRLWGLFAKLHPDARDFFAHHFVANFCPLAFIEESGRNYTPDKMPASETAALYAACDEHLRAVVEALRPEWVIGVGAFAQKRAELVLDGKNLKIGTILHPSPASPAANRDWSGKATAQLQKLGIWR
jgi:single-strand selective monofunctional uracil DNA glycosylase